MPVFKILVLGGYGNFGKRIAEKISVMPNVKIFIAGRNIKKAQQMCRDLSFKSANTLFEPAVIDIYQQNFMNELKSLSPNLVVHTGGPFQGQDYLVPRACIAVGSHYIDLADDRRFVCDISSLNDKAQANDLLIVSGASSVPGLSSTVIDSLEN